MHHDVPSLALTWRIGESCADLVEEDCAEDIDIGRCDAVTGKPIEVAGMAIEHVRERGVPLWVVAVDAP